MTDVKDIATHAMSGASDLNVADLRDRLAARLQADQDAVDAARAAATQGPTDTASKALAETMFARVWPTLQEQLTASRGEDLGLGAATDALRNADPVVRPLLTEHVITELKRNGVSENSIDKFVLIPTTPALQAALDVQHKNKLMAIYAQHNLDQHEGGTSNFVTPKEN